MQTHSPALCLMDLFPELRLAIYDRCCIRSCAMLRRVHNFVAQKPSLKDVCQILVFDPVAIARQWDREREKNTRGAWHYANYESVEENSESEEVEERPTLKTLEDMFDLYIHERAMLSVGLYRFDKSQRYTGRSIVDPMLVARVCVKYIGGWEGFGRRIQRRKNRIAGKLKAEQTREKNRIAARLKVEEEREKNRIAAKRMVKEQLEKNRIAAKRKVKEEREKNRKIRMRK
jgi:hypothetical protein